MTELFPSIIPEDDTYSPLEIEDKWHYKTIRTVIAAHETDQVNGKSTKLEMAHFLSGRYSEETIDAMMDEAQTDDPNLGEIMKSAEGLSAYSNG